MTNPTTSKQELREKIRAIVEKHTLPKVTARNKKDAKNAELMGKLMAYELGLDDVVNSYVKDLEQLFTEAHESGKQDEEQKSKKLADACYKLLAKLGAGSPTLATLGSWKDTLDDEDVLEQLEELATYEKHNL